MMAALNSLSANSNICIIMISVFVESFFLLVVIFLVLGVVSDFCLYCEPGDCIMRHCILFKFFFFFRKLPLIPQGQSKAKLWVVVKTVASRFTFIWHWGGRRSTLWPPGGYGSPGFPHGLHWSWGGRFITWMGLKVPGPHLDFSDTTLMGRRGKGASLQLGEVETEAPCAAFTDGVIEWLQCFPWCRAGSKFVIV